MDKLEKYVLLFVVVFTFTLLGTFLFGIVWPLPDDGIYETTDIAEYGKITGNRDNETPKEFVDSFFPQKIEDYFSDVTYHYTATKNDSHAYECYLEFAIEDPEIFSSFIEANIDKDKTTVFRYDESFREYSITNQFSLELRTQKEDDSYAILYAVVGKILYSEQDQRVVFWALGMWDGGGTTTKQLGTFFSRFDIDVVDYYYNAYTSPSTEEAGIINAEFYNLDR